ncbi:hypothetical protein [Rhizobium sp. RCAM05973]|uniref:hypothetical protein n=1 Tax=Rhizobium sp. RCAM05973 TaxID=2994066 RepID=UPI0022EC1692|nr:hypothetical protein [Rhizobium sp. RCAM05973]
MMVRKPLPERHERTRKHRRLYGGNGADAQLAARNLVGRIGDALEHRYDALGAFQRSQSRGIQRGGTARSLE